MKSENIIAALNDIDPELIEDAEGKHKKSFNTVFLKWGAVAAMLCIAFACILGYVIPTSQPPVLATYPSITAPTLSTTAPTPSTTIPKPSIPAFEHALYTASEIADFFSATNSATSSYQKVYVPSSEYLYLRPIPDDSSLPLFQYTNLEKEFNGAEFEQFTNTRLERFASELGVTVPTEMITFSKEWLDIRLGDNGEYNFYAEQNERSNHLFFYSKNSATPEIRMGNVVFEIDQTQSDSEIIASLSEVKEKLFHVFDVQFSDIKIERRYDSYHGHGAAQIYVYFYNEADHPLNVLFWDRSVTDFICLSFSNHRDFISETILRDVRIDYYQFRFDVNELYAVTRQAPIISLQEAETLLYKGYVFGGHSCSLCMAEQDKVDFNDYDFVEIVYIESARPYDGPKNIIPFYAFYKKIGTAENGNEIYAKTYVPAIQVSGYEEYFKSQEAKHNN